MSNTTESSQDKMVALLALSKCLDQDTIDSIQVWIQSLQETQHLIHGIENQPVEFHTTMVDGCQPLSEENQHGISDQILEAQFSSFGRILSSLPDPNPVAITQDTLPIVLISFTNEDQTLENLVKYERMLEVDAVFNFQICSDGKPCGHTCLDNTELCTPLQDIIDVFMYDPLTMTQSFYCPGLTGGIASTITNENGDRVCYCTCPAGYERHDTMCEPVVNENCPCEWEKNNYLVEIKQPITHCQFTNISWDWNATLAIPYASDNYVGDARTNDHDVNTDTFPLENGPHIELKLIVENVDIYDNTLLVETFGDVIKNGIPKDFLTDPAKQSALHSLQKYVRQSYELTNYSHPYTWKEYETDPAKAIQAFVFNSYGRYMLEIDAHDYTNDTKCVGCLAIIDSYRPKHTQDCPKPMCDKMPCNDNTGTMTLINEDARVQAQQVVDQVYRFDENVDNDICTESRCDVTESKIIDFFKSESEVRVYDNYEDGKKCFDLEEIENALFTDPILYMNPLLDDHSNVIQTSQPVLEGHCTRCCSYRHELKEWWVDYSCDQGIVPLQCDGLESEKCMVKQCMVIPGYKLAKANAIIVDEIAKSSQVVIDSLPKQGYQTYTQIHKTVASTCSKLNADNSECSYTAKFSDLIDTSDVKKNFFSITSSPRRPYVFWRYKIGENGDWKLIGEEQDDYVFAVTETKIHVEAWTQCGRVHEFLFYVFVHLDRIVNACEHFTQMWYQTTGSQSRKDVLCAYPRSDFAELTFDYQPDRDVQFDLVKLPVTASSVTCTMNFDGQEPITVVDETGETIQRFAIELVNNPTTHKTTNLHVSCSFGYDRFDGTPTELTTCNHEFIIEDCTPPDIDLPFSHCEFSDCAASGAGPYQVCDGTIISSSGDATIIDDRGDCCQGCQKENVVTTCESILNLPGIREDIKRCVPHFPESTYTHLMAMGQDMIGNNISMISLIGASAMIAIVALIVIRRRHSTQKQVMEDAYYPLLH